VEACQLEHPMPVTKRLARFPEATGSITRLALEQLREHSVNVRPLLRRAGLSVSDVNDPNVRLSVAGQIKFLEASAEALGDHLLGFHLARGFELRRVGLLYYVMASSETLMEAQKRAERYGSVVNEGVRVNCVPGRELKIQLTYVGIPRHSDRQQMEFWITVLVRACRQLTGRNALSPARVRVAHHRSATVSEFSRFLGSAIQFDAAVDEVVFSEAAKYHPMPNADPYLNELLIRYCNEVLASRRSAGSALRSRVENAIAPLLPHGAPTARQVAAKLGISYRTLARRLSVDQLTFADILADLRADLAARYFNDVDLSVSQIAWLLGYRQVSSFTHAFKNRTGRTPTDARWQELSRSPTKGRGSGSVLAPNDKN
jgi:AraC-like DNA-binding protein